MKTPASLVAWLLPVVVATPLHALGEHVEATALQFPATSVSVPDDGRGTDYVVSKADNICGLDSPKQLSNPCKVAYDTLLAATPEIRLMKKDKIDETSARGIQLRTKAQERVQKACEDVMTEKSHCSVWKKIKRRDGKTVSDISEAVKKKMKEDEGK